MAAAGDSRMRQLIQAASPALFLSSPPAQGTAEYDACVAEDDCDIDEWTKEMGADGSANDVHWIGKEIRSKTRLFAPFCSTTKNHLFTKTGSGQT